MGKIKLKPTDVGIIIGVLLILSAAFTLIFSEANKNTAAKTAEEIVVELRGLMPDITDAAPDGRRDVIMSASEVGRDSFVGVIEVPKYGAELPIGEKWKKSRATSLPLKFSGSIYDGSLIIGGSANIGQLDFAGIVENDDNIFITDMTGDRYKYKVFDVIRTDDVSKEHLTAVGSDLVIFAKNSLSFDYTIIRCRFDY